MKTNKEIQINVAPLNKIFFWNRDENSLFKVLIILEKENFIRDELIQKIGGISIKINIIFIQFNWIKRTGVGSNIENKLVIILFYYMFLNVIFLLNINF